MAQERVDVEAIMEVGMGGLLDSTNVCRPDLTAHYDYWLRSCGLLAFSGKGLRAEGWDISNVPLVTGRIGQKLYGYRGKDSSKASAPLCL